MVGQLVRPGSRGSDSLAPPDRSGRLCEETTRAQGLPAGRQAEKPGQIMRPGRALLGDDPNAILEALKAAVRAGASPVDLGRSLAYAAARRVAHFGTANEHADWETAHHVFSYSNAVHQILKRIAAGSAFHDADPRPWGILHGAMAVYLSRYLNVPPARLPDEAAILAQRPSTNVEDDSRGFTRRLRPAAAGGHAGRLVARHLTLGHPPGALIATLRRALLREDAGFHAYQMLEAGARQFGEWGNTDEGRHILIAVARYLAAHSPTERAAFQTADIARRLMRGGELHQEATAGGNSLHWPRRRRSIMLATRARISVIA